MTHISVRRFAAAGLLAASALGTAAACTVPPPPPPPPSSTTTTTAPPGSCSSGSAAITCMQIQAGGLPRKLYYHVSPQPAPAAGRPVVFFFHGDGGTGNMNLAALYAQTDPDGAIVIQPDGPNNISSLNRGGTAWSFSMNGSQPDDVGFTKTMVDRAVAGTLIPGATVDSHRFYATGSSRGGFMVNTLLVDSRTASTFAAVANLSGNFFCEDGDNVCDARINGTGFATTAGVLHIHGSADGVVAPSAPLPNPVTSSISWPWPEAFYADANGCQGDFAYKGQIGSIDNKPTHLYKPAGTCARDIQLVYVQGAGHGFFNWEPYTWSFLKTKATP